MANLLTIAGMPTCSASGNVTAETAFGIAPANTVRAFLQAPAIVGNSSLDGHELLLRLGIMITGGTTTNYTPSVRFYSGGNTALTTFTNDTAIATPTAFAVNTVTRLFTLQARINWAIDPTPANSRLNGCFSSSIDTTFTNWATLTAGLSASLTNASSIQFCVTGIFSATNAGNTAVLKYFEMDLI